VDKQTVESLRDFSIQYPLFALFDWVRETGWGRTFVAALGGTIVSALARILARINGWQPKIKHTLNGVLLACLWIASVVALATVLSNQPIESRHGEVTAESAHPPTLTPIELIKDDDFATREKFRPILMSSATAGFPHPVEIVATLESQEIAIHLASWIAMSGWHPREHGRPNAWVGVPNEYALDDGVTIRAPRNSVDAETLRFALAMIGLTARIVVLSTTDKRDYPILEIGNLPK
jgi:hypothetical protein